MNESRSNVVAICVPNSHGDSICGLPASYSSQDEYARAGSAAHDERSPAGFGALGREVSVDCVHKESAEENVERVENAWSSSLVQRLSLLLQTLLFSKQIV